MRTKFAIARKHETTPYHAMRRYRKLSNGRDGDLWTLTFIYFMTEQN